jgi:hypothetical protein
VATVPSDLKYNKSQKELRGGVREPEKFFHTDITDHSG